jgi:hypothetical protein
MVLKIYTATFRKQIEVVAQVHMLHTRIVKTALSTAATKHCKKE